MENKDKWTEVVDLVHSLMDYGPSERMSDEEVFKLVKLVLTKASKTNRRLLDHLWVQATT